MENMARDYTDLTPGQLNTLAAIEQHWANWGFSPSIRDVSKAIGASSPNAVADHLNALETKGYITRQPGVSRSIVVVD